MSFCKLLICSQIGKADFRSEAILPLQHVLAQLLADGLLQSNTPKGPVKIGFPLDTLGVLFPNLYPEAASLTLDY